MRSFRISAATTIFRAHCVRSEHRS
jgi:hypothetical protein